MSVCENCVREYVWNGGDNPIPGECRDCQVGLDGKPTNYQRKPKTNADRIRAMSDEELAEDFCKTVLAVMEQLGFENTGNMEDAVRVRLEWLKQPAEVYNG